MIFGWYRLTISRSARSESVSAYIRNSSSSLSGSGASLGGAESFPETVRASHDWDGSAGDSTDREGSPSRTALAVWSAFTGYCSSGSECSWPGGQLHHSSAAGLSLARPLALRTVLADG